jgi:hypothetical protein
MTGWLKICVFGGRCLLRHGLSQPLDVTSQKVLYGMLRDPQHQRKIIKDINSPPFVPSINSGQTLSPVEGLREGFQ